VDVNHHHHWYGGDATLALNPVYGRDEGDVTLGLC